MSATMHRPLDYPVKQFTNEANQYATDARKLLWQTRHADVVHTCRAPTFAPEHVSFRSEAILSSATKTDANYAGLAKLGTTFRELKNNRNFMDSQAIETEDLDEMIENLRTWFPPAEEYDGADDVDSD